VFRFFCEKGFFYQQYVECVEFDEKGQPLPYAISGEEWGNFLCEIFDEWLRSDIHRVSVRLFDAILANIVQNQHTMCSGGPECGRYFVVEYNGDIYPCDFFVDENLKIGNVNKDSWSDLQKSPVFVDFAAMKGKWNAECVECKYRSFCFGDCLKNRFYLQRNPEQLSWLCRGWKIFYEHALPGFMSIKDNLTSSSSRN
jgi:uncharacterized protein